jgi:NAD(P)-dependent dehydrogenase (short-subunit alcohol dehydrogenase family)
LPRRTAHVLAAEVRNLAGSRLDILVCDASISNNTTVETLSAKEFDSLFAINVRSVRTATQSGMQLRAKLSLVIKNRLMPWA